CSDDGTGLRFRRAEPHAGATSSRTHGGPCPASWSTLRAEGDSHAMKLYGFPPTRSIRVLWTLRELDVEFEFVNVDPTKGEHRRPQRGGGRLCSGIRARHGGGPGEAHAARQPASPARVHGADVQAPEGPTADCGGVREPTSMTTRDAR